MALNAVCELTTSIVTASKALQQPQLQIKSACGYIEIIIEIYQATRNDEGKFKEVFDMAEMMANLMEVELKIPRQCGRQKHRSNVSKSGGIAYEYFR